MKRIIRGTVIVWCGYRRDLAQCRLTGINPIVCSCLPSAIITSEVGVTIIGQRKRVASIFPIAGRREVSYPGSVVGAGHCRE